MIMIVVAVMMYYHEDMYLKHVQKPFRRSLVRASLSSILNFNSCIVYLWYNEHAHILVEEFIL